MIEASVFIERRKKLSKSLGGKLVLLANGELRPRTSASTPYSFRGNSNFLYFCGNQPPGSYVLLEGSKSYLFLEPMTSDYHIWNAPFPNIEELTANFGFTKVMPKDRIVKHLVLYGTEDVLSIPTSCTLYNKKLEALIGEAPDVLTRDRALAEQIIELRMKHDAESEAELRKACDILPEAFAAGKSEVAAGRNGYCVLAAMEAVLRREGMTPSFPPIVSPYGQILHNNSYSDEFKHNDVILVDFGAETPYGMASDVTRCWPVKEKFDEKQSAIYNIVLAAQNAAIAEIKPGVRFRDLHLLAARIICDGLKQLGILKGEVDSLVERGAYGLFMPHGLGHLIGLDVHDMEDMGDVVGYPEGRERSSEFGLNYLRLDRDLEPQMAVTIEPGIYFISGILDDSKRREEFADIVDFEKVESYLDIRGIRIEDVVLVKDDGAEVLTAAIPK